MILFVPSTGFQSSAILPIALPGGSRTSRTSFSEIIVPGTLPLSGQNTLRIGYRITEERKRIELDLVREACHRGQLREAHPQSVREIHAARHRPGLGEEQALGNP